MKADTTKKKTLLQLAKALYSDMSSKELSAAKTLIVAEHKKRQAVDIKMLQTKFARLAKAADVSLEDVFGAIKTPQKPKKTGKRKPRVSAPKYANPADESKTWTGKGRQPDWYKIAIAAGKSPAQMAI
jgi:DNA-binding protein H-NS